MSSGICELGRLLYPLMPDWDRAGVGFCSNRTGFSRDKVVHSIALGVDGEDSVSPSSITLVGFLELTCDVCLPCYCSVLDS